MKSSLKLIHWTPRVLCILAIVFISLFAILGGESINLTFWERAENLLMGLLPVFGLIILLIVAWNWEKIGGMIFIFISVVLSPLVYIHNYNMTGSVSHGLFTVLIITIPFLIVGILFTISHYLKIKDKIIT